MVWLETPTNPLLKLIDIKGAAEVVHQHKVNLLNCSLQYMFCRFCTRFFSLANLDPVIQLS